RAAPGFRQIFRRLADGWLRPWRRGGRAATGLVAAAWRPGRRPSAPRRGSRCGRAARFRGSRARRWTFGISAPHFWRRPGSLLRIVQRAHDGRPGPAAPRLGARQPKQLEGGHRARAALS
nr:hypothetical protein [Tanacetum cinerariifolium]